MRFPFFVVVFRAVSFCFAPNSIGLKWHTRWHPRCSPVRGSRSLKGRPRGISLRRPRLQASRGVGREAGTLTQMHLPFSCGLRYASCFRREVRHDSELSDRTSVCRSHGRRISPDRARGGRQGQACCQAADTHSLGSRSVRRFAAHVQPDAAGGPSAEARLTPSAEPIEIRPERGLVAPDQGYSGDGALQGADGMRISQTALTIPAPLQNFEGLSNQDNFNLFGFRVNPPDPVGAVGPNHYVEMVNLAFAVYDKLGNSLLGPVDTGDRSGPASRFPTALPLGRPDRSLRQARGSLDPQPVHDGWPLRSDAALLQLRRSLDHRGPDWRLLPLRVQYHVRRCLLLPRLPQVWQLEEILRAHFARLRTRRRVRHQRLRAGKEQDDRRQPEGPHGAFLHRRE